MNFDAFWQKHRRFLMGIAGAMLAFLIVEGILGSTARSDLRSAERRIRAARGSLGKRAYDSGAESEVKNRLGALDARKTALAADTLPPWRDEFRPETGQSHSQYYIERTGRLRQDLVPWVLRNNIDIDESLGMPPVSPTEAQKIERVLRGLDVVDRVARLAVDSGARSIEDIEISLRASSRRIARRKSPLDLTPVTMTVFLPEGRAFPFLSQLVSADPPLGLVMVDMGKVDARKRHRGVVLEFNVGELPQPVEDEG